MSQNSILFDAHLCNLSNWFFNPERKLFWTCLIAIHPQPTFFYLRDKFIFLIFSIKFIIKPKNAPLMQLVLMIFPQYRRLAQADPILISKLTSVSLFLSLEFRFLFIIIIKEADTPPEKNLHTFYFTALYISWVLCKRTKCNQRTQRIHKITYHNNSCRFSLEHTASKNKWIPSLLHLLVQISF